MSGQAQPAESAAENSFMEWWMGDAVPPNTIGGDDLDVADNNEERCRAAFMKAWRIQSVQAEALLEALGTAADRMSTYAANILLWGFEEKVEELAEHLLAAERAARAAIEAARSHAAAKGGAG